MNIIEAANALKKGEQVRRADWIRKSVVGGEFDASPIIMWGNGNRFIAMLSIDDLLAEDWEVME